MTVNVNKGFLGAIERIVTPFVEKIKPFLSGAPEDKLHTKEQIEREILDLLSAKPLRERFDQGFSAIVEQLVMIVSPKEFEIVRMEWSHAVGKISEIFKSYQDQEHKKETESLALQDLLGISEETMGLFYQCGCNLYEHRQFQEASQVFFVVAFLNIGRSNPWISLGLASKQIENHEEALHAFAMASIADTNSAIPQIYSAECYIAMKQYPDAIASLEFASEIATDHPQDNHPKLHDYINEMIIRYREKS